MKVTAHAGPAIGADVVESIRMKLQAATIPHYIDGAFRPSRSGATFETLEPSTNRMLSRVARGDRDDIADAAAAAKAAFE